MGFISDHKSIIIVVGCLFFISIISIIVLLSGGSPDYTEGETIQGNFPTYSDEEYFSIQYKNSTNSNIIVWLDDQPFCPNNNTYACAQGDPNTPSDGWSRGLGKFYIVSENNNKWNVNESTPGRKQLLKKGEIWKIVPPVGDDGNPYWCFDQGGNRTCTGVGAYVTVEGTEMLAIDQVSKFEYNINGGTLYFDVSSVDGINVNTIVEYTGCTEKKRTCTIDMNSCPIQITTHGVRTCPSPKTWPGIDDCGTSGVGVGMGTDGTDLTARQLAGCGYGGSASDPDNKLKQKGECHKWWAKNECGQQWLNYLQKNQSGKPCSQYGWAYNEMVYNDGDTFDIDFNPCRGDARTGNGTCMNASTNPVEPLISCDINAGSLRINILDILV
jgi:hypothetical protein